MYHQDPIPSEKARFEYLHSFYSKINRGISRPSLLVHKLLNFLYGCNLLSDKLFLSLKFRLKMGGGINWKSPHTFNEKLQWLKLYNRRPEYTIMADKIEAKKWVAERIGEKYIIPTLGVWTKAEEVDFDTLPDKFVIKCNHNSGTGMYICKDKQQMDVQKVRNGLRTGLQEDYFHHNGEWPYKNIKPRIIAEQYMKIKNPALLLLTLGHREYFNWVSDKSYLKIAFWARMHKKLDLEHPKSFSEKLQWLKLYDRNPRYTQLCDKYEVKAIVGDIIGHEYLIPTLGVWEKFEDIDFSKLPERFVLKCTHDSGGVIVCKDKSKLNYKKVHRKINACLRHNFFWGMREWPYKDIKPRIIAEQYMEDNASGELRDYKFFCFDGKVKALFIASDRMTQGEETKFDFFDADYNHLPFRNGHPNASVLPNKPLNFDKMKELAAQLSAGYPQVRVDLYEVNGKVYFGELTFFHWSGMTPFEPEDWDYKFGEWLTLPPKTR